MWVNGVDVDWRKRYRNRPPKRISLPGYPFLKESYWLRADSEADSHSVLHYFIPDWKADSGVDDISVRSRNGGGTDAVLFISALNNPHLVKQLKHRYPRSTVINVKKDISPDDPLSFKTYDEIFFALKESLRHKRDIESIAVLCYEPQAYLYTGFSGCMQTLAVEGIIKRSKLLTLPSSIDLRNVMEIIERELGAWRQAQSQVRYREGDWKRSIKYYRQLQTADMKPPGSPLRESGVYWLTGGLGGLGKLFVESLGAETTSARWFLSGRSPLDEKGRNWIKTVREKGINVVYLQGNLANRKSVETIHHAIVTTGGPINGVIHAAGCNSDSLFLNKKLEAVSEVFDPKILGTINLDWVTRGDSLDFFCLFSSITAQFGNEGQSDYALANGFMDSFAEYRQLLRLAGRRSGKSLSINWPLWEQGGMSVDRDVKARMFDKWGTLPLPTEFGLACFGVGLTLAGSQLFPLYGDPARIDSIISKHNGKEAAAPSSRAVESTDFPAVQSRVKATVAGLLKIDLNRLLENADIKSYGFDSISLNRFARALSEEYRIEITAGVFFEHSTIRSIAEYIAERLSELSAGEDARNSADLIEGNNILDNIEDNIEDNIVDNIRNDVKSDVGNYIDDNIKALNTLDEKVSDNETSARPPTAQVVENFRNNDRDIAIIGIDGRFPGAENIDRLWENLIDNAIALTDIRRADLRDDRQGDLQGYIQDNALRFNDDSLGGFKSLRAGLISDIDLFDAEFFKIDAEAATMMDPQQRLLMQSIWRLVENAGYRMDRLSTSQVGLFIGASSNDYLQLFCRDAGPSNSYSQIGLSQSMLANRISYQFNLRGPSEICDTACSSSIVAIHRAVGAILQGECELAIAGGVQLLLSSRGFLGLRDMGFLSDSGHTRPFEARADGYVRGEGLGCVLLKPLAFAERDRDHIYAIIKGSAVYHGGNGNLSLVSPSVNGQAQAVIQALRRAGVDPTSIGYIEAHGSGTQFGDPAEIGGIKKAFKTLLNGDKKEWRCGLGSIKPNIGHLEAASGMAALSKVVMALTKNRKPPLTGYRTLHPSLSFKNSPFYIVQTAETWQADDSSTAIPRRCGLNSYGFGGVNAHLVLEAYRMPQTTKTHGFEVIALSALSVESLEEKIKALKQFLIDNREPISLCDISYTLCSGRMPFPVRLAIVAREISEVIECLENYQHRNNCFYERLPPGGNLPFPAETIVPKNLIITIEEARKLAKQWMLGKEMDWRLWFENRAPRKIALPVHTFRGKSCWYRELKIKTTKQSVTPLKGASEFISI